MRKLTEIDFLIDHMLSLELSEKDLDKIESDEHKFTNHEKDYVKKIRAYVKEIKQAHLPINMFVSEGFNLFVSLFYYFYCVKNASTFEKFYKELKDLNSQEFLKLIEDRFDIKGEITIEKLNDTELQIEGKWCILSFYKDFQNTKKLLLKVYEKTHKIYKKHYKEVRGEFSYLIENKLRYLDLNLDKILNKTYYESIPNVSLPRSVQILPLSLNKLSIHVTNFSKENNFFVNVGLFIWDMIKDENVNLSEKRCIEILKLLADPTRFMMLKLIKSGIYTNKSLSSILSITSAGVTYQMKTLIDHELLQKNEDTGKYEVNEDILTRVFESIQRELII